MDACLLQVMSFNIRGSIHEVDGINAWSNRSALNVETIERHAPDLIGFQELQGGNLDTYREKLPGYDHVLGPGYGPERPCDFNAIFFDSARLELLDSGGFWLSETPETFSQSWQAAVARSVNWARFRCKISDLSLLHLNTHFDHVSEPARVEGSKLLLQRTAELRKGRANDLPVIVTGDFNCAPGSPPHQAFTSEGFLDTYIATDDEGTEAAYTFHAFKGSRYPETRRVRESRRIDWILLQDSRQQVRTRSQRIIRDSDEVAGIFPSDHYPLLAEFLLLRGTAGSC